jgi:hypothetical protein
MQSRKLASLISETDESNLTCMRREDDKDMERATDMNLGTFIYRNVDRHTNSHKDWSTNRTGKEQ